MSESGNPWVSRPKLAEPAIGAAPTATTVRVASGPVTPQRGVPAPDRVDQLPTIDRTPAVLWCLGAHGGSGESTIAALVDGWRAAGHAWPRVPTAEPARVVVTARSNVRGLRAAQAAATQWAAGLVPSVQLVGLVVISDAPGRLPRPLRDLAQVVGGGFPRTWTLPWLESWRLDELTPAASSPREVRRVIDELRAILPPGTDAPALRKEP